MVSESSKERNSLVEVLRRVFGTRVIDPKSNEKLFPEELAAREIALLLTRADLKAADQLGR